MDERPKKCYVWVRCIVNASYCSETEAAAYLEKSTLSKDFIWKASFIKQRSWCMQRLWNTPSNDNSHYELKPEFKDWQYDRWNRLCQPATSCMLRLKFHCLAGKVLLVCHLWWMVTCVRILWRVWCSDWKLVYSVLKFMFVYQLCFCSGANA